MRKIKKNEKTLNMVLENAPVESIFKFPQNFYTRIRILRILQLKFYWKRICNPVFFLTLNVRDFLTAVLPVSASLHLHNEINSISTGLGEVGVIYCIG
jgi:hypothetical protein